MHYAGGVTNRTVNQIDQALDSQWNSLGSYTFDQASFVRVVHDGGTSTTTSADALRFSPVIEPGILDKYTSGSNDGSGFNIEINFEGTWTVELQQDFIASSEFLSDTIVGDLADVFFGGKVIDDIRIDATLEKIDGVGGVLGQAGATAIRTSNSLPATAIMEFDIADATNFNALDLWDDIILHEMTHSIGFSSGIWELIGGLITGNNTSNPLFTGASAISVYKSILLDPTGIIGVPLEVGEGAGTDFSHWDEETFYDELMTGFINSSNVYSDMTVAALEDMGYDTVLFDSGASYNIQNHWPGLDTSHA